jgi:hypothetical protein
MKSETYPLALPPDLLKEVRKAAKKRVSRWQTPCVSP